MRVSSRQNVMKDLTVKEAMRRLIINLTAEATLEEAIRYAIKYKVNAILITDADQDAVGVVTKTDLMGAYYAGLPLVYPGGLNHGGPAPVLPPGRLPGRGPGPHADPQNPPALCPGGGRGAGRGRPGLPGHRGFALPLLPSVRQEPAPEYGGLGGTSWPTGCISGK